MHEVSADGINWRKAEEFGELYPGNAVNVQAMEQDIAEERVSQDTFDQQPLIEWYAHIDNERKGPFDDSKLQQLIAAEKITASTLVWRSGMQDWVSAETLMPERFPGLAKRQQSLGESKQLDSLDALPIMAELVHRRRWVFVLGVTCLVIAVFQLIGMVFFLVGEVVAPAKSGGEAIVSVFTSFLGLLLAMLGVFACVNLIQYANALTVMHMAPTQDNILSALQKLSRFWYFGGILMLAAVVIFGLLMIVFYAAGRISLNSI